jgi:basic membrane protein A
MTKAVFEIIKDLAAGTAFTGDAYMGTLANDGTGLAPFHEFEGKVSADVVSKLDELKAGIIDGSIDPAK